MVVKKDVSGDGKISSIDYLKLKKHFSGNTLSGIYQKAGDSNCDDTESPVLTICLLRDILQLNNIVLA